jgi:hypothetical protein
MIKYYYVNRLGRYLAFTIPDLLTSIAIGSLVTSLCMYGLLLITKIYTREIKAANDISNVQFVYSSMLIDMLNSDHVELSNLSLKYNFPSSSTTWNMENRILIKTTETELHDFKIDTFDIECSLRNVEYCCDNRYIKEMKVCLKNNTIERSFIMTKKYEYKKIFNNI